MSTGTLVNNYHAETDPFYPGTYRLLPGSPAIDAGDPASIRTIIDLAGAPRITGLAADIVAYEYSEALVLLPNGDWSAMFEALSRKFATRTNIVISSGHMPSLPTATNGLVAGDLWHDGTNLKVME